MCGSGCPITKHCSFSDLTKFYKYRLLAFITALKRVRRNSCLYNYDSNLELSKLLQTDRNTFAKYKKECVRLGLLNKSGSGYQFVGLKKAVFILLGDEDALRHVSFFNQSKSNKLSLSEINEEIKYGIALRNFNQQQFKIKRKQEILQGFRNRFMPKRVARRVKKMCKEYSCQPSDLPRILNCNSNVITGKNHLAKILGCSPTAAVTLLKKWNDNNLIKRTVIAKKVSMPKNHGTFDYLKSIYNRYIIPVSDGYLVSLGSVIQVPSA